MHIKNWFSNMTLFDSPLVFEGISYKSVENFYQAMKVDDIETRRYIASLSPRKSKTEMTQYLIREGWNITEKLKVMEFAINHKFTLQTTWGKRLLETTDEDIVEYNSWNDTFWGVDVETGVGKNHLGIMLMARRKTLITEKIITETIPHTNDNYK